MEVRSRFAPSPTGYMHIGNLRTALYEYLVAKSAGGKFILRIEDTDQERYVEGAVDIIYKTMQMVGLQHDEGPDVGGDYGPYVQSERKPIYKEYADNNMTKVLMSAAITVLMFNPNASRFIKNMPTSWSIWAARITAFVPKKSWKASAKPVKRPVFLLNSAIRVSV